MVGGWIRGVGRGVALALAFASAGCDHTPPVDAAAQAACECLPLLPTQLDECVQQFTGFLTQAPAECLDCILETQCRAVNAGACNDVCAVATPRAASRQGARTW